VEAPKVLTKNMAEPSMPALVLKPESAPAPLGDATPRVRSDQWTMPAAAKAEPAATIPTPPVAPKATAAVIPALPFDKANILPEKPPAEPILEAPVLPAKTTAKPSVQASPPLAPSIGFTNIEAVVEDSAEMQFSIKIEHQAIESTHTPRPAQRTTPVASQITTQLPQLLTKAEKQVVELRLDPPELGRVTIHLSTHDTQVTAHVVAERVDTIDLMRRHAELLSDTLANAGFSQADLSFQQGHEQSAEDEHEKFQLITSISESEGALTSTPTLSGQDGRLDIRL